MAIQSKGNQVCTCFNISETAINSFLRTCEGSEPEQLSTLQAELKCGTNCGSCLPQLKKIIRLNQLKSSQQTADAI